MGKNDPKIYEKAKKGNFAVNPQNINRTGANRSSFKKVMAELFEKEGKIIVPKEQVDKINEDGSVIIKLPTNTAIAMKLFSLAMSGNMRAISEIMDRVDGKPRQEIDIASSQNIKLPDWMDDEWTEEHEKKHFGK